MPPRWTPTAARPAARLRLPWRVALGAAVFAAWIASVAPSAVAQALNPDRAPFFIPPAWMRFRSTIDRFDTLEFRGRRADAWAYLDSLVAAQRATGTQQRLVQALIKRGGTRAFRGEYRTGEPDLQEALRVSRAIRDTLGEILALQYIAYAAMQSGRFDTAQPLYERMLRLSVARRDASHEGWARMGRAFMDLRSGRLTGAAEGYRRVLALMQRCGDTPGVLEARTGLANTFHQLGRDEAAAEEYRRLVEEAGRVGLRQIQVNAYLNLASVENDPALAVRHMIEAERLCRETHNRAGAWAAARVRAAALGQLGRLDEAAAALTASIDESRAQRAFDDWSASIQELARTRFRQGRSSEAEAILRTTLLLGDSISPRLQESAAAELASELLTVERPRDALGVIDTLRARPWFPTTGVTGDRTRAVAALALLSLGRPREALARLDAPAERAGGPPSDPLFYGSRVARAGYWRAVGRRDSARAILEDALRNWDSSRFRTNDPDWRETLGGNLGRLIGPLIDASLADAGQPTPPGDARRAFEVLQTVKARTLAERIDAGTLRARSPEGDAPVTLARVQRLLAPGEALLDFYSGAPASALFVVTTRGLQAVRLPGWREIEAPLRRARSLFGVAGADTTAIRNVAAGIADLIWAGRAELPAGTRRVIVAADGLFQDLPFELLPLRRGGPPLLALAEVAHTPSARVFVRLRERAAGSAPRALFALAGSRNERGQRLSGAEDEVRWLARQYDGVDARTSAQVRTSAELSRELARHQVLHFAGHASNDVARPWRDGLLVGDGLGEDDWLRAGQIARLKLPARLAVLSACGSTGGWAPTEGRRGLATAFLSAGVPAVVATRWPVSDAAAEAFTRELYPRLERGLPAVTAVREAQLALRARPATAAPAEWAGFLLVGEPGVRVTLRRAGRLLPRLAQP